MRVLRRARHLLAERAGSLAEAMPSTLQRTSADTLVTEVLPLLDACRFLERNAAKLLKPRRLGSKGRPLWLSGIQAEVQREPLGHVLIIGPANFPLFLPGVQTLQALAAGNSVTWKAGEGGACVATVFAQAMLEAGLPVGVLTVGDESIDAGKKAIAAHPDKVIFTGSSHSGQAVLGALAATSTPAVVELSGADAIIVMPGADLAVVARAVAFGLRLNGSAVCMSPRRLLATAATLHALKPILQKELNEVPAVALPERIARQLSVLLEDAVSQGAELLGVLDPTAQRPLLIDNAAASMAIAQADIFAPVLSLLAVESMMHVPGVYGQCPYALTLSVFCGKSEVKRGLALARTLRTGTVLINDLIAPTADPRVPFGGRGASGYGVTRGAEGLLEMTAVKTVLVRRGGAMRHLDATTEADAPLFAAMIAASHGESWTSRWRAMRDAIRAVRNRHQKS